MFYGEPELEAVRKQLKKAIIIVSGILLVFLIAAFAFMTQWPAWIGTLFLLVVVCFCIFLWGMHGTPVLAYYRFVRDIVTGRTREVIGKVTKVSQNPVYKDNKLFFYEVWINEDDVEIVLLFDINMGEPKVELDRSYTFIIHESYIVEIMG